MVCETMVCTLISTETLLFDIFATFHPIFKFVPPLVPMVVALDTQLTGVVQRAQIAVTWGWFTVSGLRSLRLRKLM
jgi:ABC-type Na+ efflux pump permease subunit